MVNDVDRNKAEVIKRSFKGSPMPDKFNDHNLSIRVFNPMHYSASNTDLPDIINNFFRENRIGQGLVAKWFNRDGKGYFNINLVAERGLYNASVMQAEIARFSARGSSLLADAGAELIYNTFVVVNRFNYIPKEEIIDAASRGVNEVARLVNRVEAVRGVNLLLDLASDVAAEGYVVQAHSYLYKLKWNDSIAAVFYNNYWVDESSMYSVEEKQRRKLAFENSDIFQLEFVGFDAAWALLPATIFTQKTEEELIYIATVRAIDAVIAKLQREHDVFKTKAPLYTVEPLSAKIGLKEGLTNNCRFEVLEKTIDKNGRTKYVRKGVIRVDGQIWDNRFMADEERELTEGADNLPVIDRTHFRGRGKFYPGMLIRQIR